MAKVTTQTAAATPGARYTELKRMLMERQGDIQVALQAKIRDVRAEASGKSDVFDAVESSGADMQDDIEFALIQMKTETLNTINGALTRLENGTYGNCFDCGDEITERRLRALPFAIRCKECEEAREAATHRERQLASRRGASTPRLDV